MPHERLRPSFVFDEERLKQLQQIAPEAFADGNINWDVLKESLGERLEEEGAEVEHFGLFWPGKREARKIASIPSQGALIPVKGEGVNEDKTKNIFIEGENLEVLKLLQKSYAGKIKMIYIDPPYNTGNDFIYDDNFTEPLEEYLKYTGQMDEEGKLLTTNKRADGRFHSKWLSMMYPRLRLARNLLREDGLIFVSIDDNEFSNLKKICDEIFGEECFIGCLVWIKKRKGSFLSKQMVSVTEYCLIYSKEIDTQLFGGKPDDSESQPLVKRTNPVCKLKFTKGLVHTKLPDGKYKAGKYGTGTSAVELVNDIIIRNGIIETEFILEGPFVWSQKNLDEQVLKGARVIINTDNLQVRVFKVYDDSACKGLFSVVDGVEIGGTNEDGYEELIRIFKAENIMDYPKPSNYIKYLLNSGTFFEKECIILDFFAGSCTTAHATMLLNNETVGNRKFICVQLPEQCDEDSNAYRAGYKNIAELGKERIRRVIKVIEKESDKKIELGFRVFKLEKSNFKQWQDYKGKDPKELTSLFKEHEIPLIDGWRPENLLIEVMLQEGFPLDSEIAELKEHKKNAVMQVRSEFCEHKLLVCFDKKIYQEIINALDIQGEDIFVCLDSALSDEQKITLSDKGFLKTI